MKTGGNAEQAIIMFIILGKSGITAKRMQLYKHIESV
jgi:hypothetical protein